MTISAEYLSQDEFNLFCEFIIDGKTTRQAAAALQKNRTSICKWINSHASQTQVDHYARALQMSADAFAEDGLEIADDDTLDIGFDEEGKPFVKGENIQRSKLKSDYRKWLASKRLSKKYGDSTQIKHADADGNKLTFSGILNELNGRTAGLPASDKETE